MFSSAVVWLCPRGAMKELKVRFFSGAISSTHTIFLKQHSVRKSSSLVPSGKSILSLGWPPYCPKESIAELFSRVGQVLSVNIRDQPGSIEIEQSTAPTGRFHVAYVTFSSASEVFKAMQLSSSAAPLPCGIGATGMSKWAAQYKLRYPDPAVVSAEVGEKIAAYDRDKEATKALLKKGVTEPDADGWITVTRKNYSKIHQSKQQ